MFICNFIFQQTKSYYTETTQSSTQNSTQNFQKIEKISENFTKYHFNKFFFAENKNNNPPPFTQNNGTFISPQYSHARNQNKLCLFCLVLYSHWTEEDLMVEIYLQYAVYFLLVLFDYS